MPTQITEKIDRLTNDLSNAWSEVEDYVDSVNNNALDICGVGHDCVNALKSRALVVNHIETIIVSVNDIANTHQLLRKDLDCLSSEASEEFELLRRKIETVSQSLMQMRQQYRNQMLALTKMIQAALSL